MNIKSILRSVNSKGIVVTSEDGAGVRTFLTDVFVVYPNIAGRKSFASVSGLGRTQVSSLKNLKAALKDPCAFAAKRGSPDPQQARLVEISQLTCN